MKTKLIKGYHITQVEIRSIKQMIEIGLTSARNRTNTKNYEIIQGTPNKQGYEYRIRIGSKFEKWYGEGVKWHYSEVTIQHISKPILNNLQLF